MLLIELRRQSASQKVGAKRMNASNEMERGNRHGQIPTIGLIHMVLLLTPSLANQSILCAGSFSKPVNKYVYAARFAAFPYERVAFEAITLQSLNLKHPCSN